MRITDDIEIKQNLVITARERGKIVGRHESHNIFLDTGREWISKLIAFESFGPDVPQEDARIKYMGFGIGGTQQIAPGTANSTPISPPYTGTNLQTDTDASVTVLERPVRISGSSSAYPGLAGDEWLGVIQAPAAHPDAKKTEFHRVFTESEVSYAPFISVPLSEIGLFNSSADEENFQNIAMAYDTFDTISKTTAVVIEVVWTFIFG